jgi:transposase
LSLYARERIVSLLSTNTSVVRITKSLNEEGIKVSRSAVNLFICRFRKTEILHDAPRSGRKLKLSDEQITFIDQKMRENDELTAAEANFPLYYFNIIKARGYNACT